MQLSDLTWGDVVSDDGGILVVRAELAGDPVLVKRYALAEHRREIGNHALLARLGVPTLRVLGAGDDWLVLADLEDAGWRQGTPDDRFDPHVARLLARWYDRLHAAGESLSDAEVAGLFSETDVVDADGLARVAARWPELALQVAWAQDQLPAWRDLLAGLPRTLTHNDFWDTNLAVAWDSSAALMYDHHLLGAGLRASDLRNVTESLSQQAADAFLAEYHARAGARGVPVDEREVELDATLGHLATLVIASEAEQLPHWAEDSWAWLRARA